MRVCMGRPVCISALMRMYRRYWLTSIPPRLRKYARCCAPTQLTMGILGLAACLIHLPQFAEGGRPVRSMLETRHEHVVLQKWDLSCGAAALATLLRYQFRENVTEQEIARALMRRNEYIDHPELIRLQEGFSLLDLKRYVQSYRTKFMNSGAKKQKNKLARSHLQSSSAGMLLNHRGQIYKGEGLGQLDFNELVERAPVMVPVNALGYNHFVIFRGVLGDRVLLADPAWGNRTMTRDKFERMWIDYGETVGHVGFVIERVDGQKSRNRLEPKPEELVMYY